MAWPNPFSRQDGSSRHAWGYDFRWTASHQAEKDLLPLRFSYDTLGEECLNRLDIISPPQNNELPRNRSRTPSKDNGDKEPDFTPKRDLYALLRDHASEDEKLMELWTEVNQVPEWVDWEQIERGQDVFYRYGGAALTALAFQSLLGGMGANRVVETLARTGGFGVKVARHRMYETTQHILQVTQSLESIKPGGAGHASSIRVRLLHAAVRRRIMRLTEQRPEYYDVEKLGIPINDLDSIATIGSFSATLIWLGFPRQGIWLRKQEIEDFIALWRLVAYYVGCPDEHFANPEAAKIMMESILYNEISPSETSKVLANNIILSLQGNPPTFASPEFLSASARWLNGDELSDALGLIRPGFYYKALVAGQCIFFMALCYTYRSIPYLDQKKLKALRRIFWTIIVENKTGLGAEAGFEFKHIPDFHINTAMEKGGDPLPSIDKRPLERRNLKILAVASVVGVGSLWLGAKVIRVAVVGLWRGFRFISMYL